MSNRYRKRSESLGAKPQHVEPAPSTAQPESRSGDLNSSLPKPRFAIKGGKLVDRWTGKDYRKSPDVMLQLLNRHSDEIVQVAEKTLQARLGDSAKVAQQLVAAKQESKDAYGLVKRERESCHELANRLHELQAVVDNASRLMTKLPRDVKDPLGDAEALLLKHATPSNQLADNPFAGDTVTS